MALAEAAINTMLDALGIDQVSLHTGDPGAAGLNNEVTGGSYARQTVTWNAASGGNLDSSNTPVVPVPGGNTVTYVGYWDAAVFQGSKLLTQSEVFGGDGNYTFSDIDIAGT